MGNAEWGKLLLRGEQSMLDFPRYIAYTIPLMGITYTEVTLRAFTNGANAYTDRFLVDTGAIDCVAPAGRLRELGVKVVGRMDYELADGRQVAFDYGLVQIEVMDRITAGRVVFGPDDAEPILGVVAIESAVLKINPVTQQLEKRPVSLLKGPPRAPRGIALDFPRYIAYTIPLMGTTYTDVTLRAFTNGAKAYTDRFLVDTGAIDCVAPGGGG